MNLGPIIQRSLTTYGVLIWGRIIHGSSTLGIVVTVTGVYELTIVSPVREGAEGVVELGGIIE